MGFSGLDGQPEKIDKTNRLIRDDHVCNEIFVIFTDHPKNVWMILLMPRTMIFN